MVKRLLHSALHRIQTIFYEEVDKMARRLHSALHRIQTDGATRLSGNL